MFRPLGLSRRIPACSSCRRPRPWAVPPNASFQQAAFGRLNSSVNDAIHCLYSPSRSDQVSARRVPVDWPREAEEKSDQNEKLSERSEFFSFRFFLSIAGKGQSSGSPFLWLLSFGEAKESDSPSGETGGARTTKLRSTFPLTLTLSREGRGDPQASPVSRTDTLSRRLRYSCTRSVTCHPSAPNFRPTGMCSAWERSS